MRVATQHRFEILLLLMSIGSTMFVMQVLWNQTNCDPLCKVMKENQYRPRSSNISSNNASLCSNTSRCSNETTFGSPTNVSIPVAFGPALGSSSVPFCSFEKGQPKLIVILTYQRCGSTFFGSLFNHNPEAFYMFEPLDSLYSSLYGTKQGWNVPSDIANYSNGTFRVRPANELVKVFEFLRTLLQCEINALPTETLVHPFIHDYFSTEFAINKNYVLCIKKQRRKIQKCAQYVPWSYCGGRFGETSDDRLSECHKLLTDDQFRRQQQHPRLFDDYLLCRKHLRLTVDQKCSSLLASSCQSRHLRVIKLVRASMESMEPLLSTFPNFRVIHLIRDPRAVTLSRSLFDSSARGLYSDSNNKTMLTREATLYCRTVVRDVKIRQRLEKLYPGKIYPILYDDMVKDLKSYAENVYRFIDSKNPSSWIRIITTAQNKKNAIERANRWQKTLHAEINREIVAVCKEFFQLIEYNWPKLT